ncbi:DUF4232 domain-containing protein [Streptomyces olivaceus]|uniref:DUF4232 domain-containing protein n=2 Tax=Streptomyces olivaceus TaxID=47716 RepID=A0ABS7W137_STROV|nr:DUF4232 domain-containing protein [Streptomyces olivaceus]MBZ6088116.1 DUF4232 domain-containing protein [Streptomyces olivaceus]MBZ6095048.1 DUF4232 domain-containing protein [Streptomyces olivaceus]MBZ6116255.1 DUF4232 domain-containing protein [Streptomyces olivaceus]MBZ6150960.1 DUF4232 domain-containing protein [Streptomyces olivaceus]MBZ6292206.1 DUF4232 domain-containing protein [Streptomyces olivaceus]
MANTSQPVRRTALLAGGLAVLGLLSACGSENGTPPPSHSARASDAAPSAGTATDPGTAAAAGTPSDTAGSASASARTDGRCHTSELRAAVGRLDPGAGQRNFPLVLTNTSERTCTVYGYPGAAFVDASGKQLGPDPERAPGSPETLTLTPGASAWAGLSFSSPEISGARTATPAALLVTPPDERASLKVEWTAGAVPVGGKASSVSVTALEAGSGP